MQPRVELRDVIVRADGQVKSRGPGEYSLERLVPNPVSAEIESPKTLIELAIDLLKSAEVAAGASGLSVALDQELVNSVKVLIAAIESDPTLKVAMSEKVQPRTTSQFWPTVFLLFTALLSFFLCSALLHC
jgi:hypothetical protein